MPASACLCCPWAAARAGGCRHPGTFCSALWLLELPARPLELGRPGAHLCTRDAELCEAAVPRARRPARLPEPGRSWGSLVRGTCPANTF